MRRSVRRFSDFSISEEDRKNLAKVDKQRAHLKAIHEQGRHPPLHGLLEKLSSKGKWQARWFEAKDHFLTYRHSEKSKKMLACIDLRECGMISEVDVVDGVSVQFSLELQKQNYMIRVPAPWTDETLMADHWVSRLVARQRQGAGESSDERREGEDQEAEKSDNSEFGYEGEKQQNANETPEIDEQSRHHHRHHHHAEGHEASSKIQSFFRRNKAKKQAKKQAAAKAAKEKEDMLIHKVVAKKREKETARQKRRASVREEEELLRDQLSKFRHDMQQYASDGHAHPPEHHPHKTHHHHHHKNHHHHHHHHHHHKQKEINGEGHDQEKSQNSVDDTDDTKEKVVEEEDVGEVELTSVKRVRSMPKRTLSSKKGYGELDEAEDNPVGQHQGVLVKKSSSNPCCCVVS